VVEGGCRGWLPSPHRVRLRFPRSRPEEQQGHRRLGDLFPETDSDESTSWSAALARPEGRRGRLSSGLLGGRPDAL